MIRARDFAARHCRPKPRDRAECIYKFIIGGRDQITEKPFNSFVRLENGLPMAGRVRSLGCT